MFNFFFHYLLGQWSEFRNPMSCCDKLPKNYFFYKWQSKQLYLSTQPEQLSLCDHFYYWNYCKFVIDLLMQQCRAKAIFSWKHIDVYISKNRCHCCLTSSFSMRGSNPGALIQILSLESLSSKRAGAISCTCKNTCYYIK